MLYKHYYFIEQMYKTHAQVHWQYHEHSLMFPLLQLKNPWARVRWKGSYSAHDTQRWTAALRTELQYEPAQALQMDNGIFWIDYGNLLKHYRGVYSNWNPALFRHHSSTHGQWPKRAAANANDSKNIGGNPQYGLRLSVSAEQVGAGRTRSAGRSPWRGCIWRHRAESVSSWKKHSI